MDSGTVISNAYGVSTQLYIDGQSSIEISVEGRDAAGNLIGTGSKEIAPAVLPKPKIRTNTRVGCERVDQPGPEDPNPLFDLEEGSCTKVCENSSLQYYAVGLKSSTYTWSVTGGVISGPTTGGTITVIWGAVGTGTITVTETNING